MQELAMKFVRDESGATSIEYGLIASGIFLAIIGALTQVGTNIAGVFAKVAANL